MNQLKTRILELQNKKRIHTTTLTALLDDIYDTFEPDFREMKIKGTCNKCVGCLHPDHEKEHSLIIGDIAFTDGGSCYNSMILLKKEEDGKNTWSSVYIYGNNRLSDYGTAHKRDVVKSLAMLEKAIHETKTTSLLHHAYFKGLLNKITH